MFLWWRQKQRERQFFESLRTMGGNRQSFQGEADVSLLLKGLFHRDPDVVRACAGRLREVPSERIAEVSRRYLRSEMKTLPGLPRNARSVRAYLHIVDLLSTNPGVHAIEVLVHLGSTEGGEVRRRTAEVLQRLIGTPQQDVVALMLLLKERDAHWIPKLWRAYDIACVSFGLIAYMCYLLVEKVIVVTDLQTLAVTLTASAFALVLMALIFRPAQTQRNAVRGLHDFLFTLFWQLVDRRDLCSALRTYMTGRLP
ncbi:MAG: hypothetical protein KatS3mg022_3469 [Armatimonadota bacterium]|nr:MAG: hypothetical protein KatS3mg022_3469 [Armatimonadota bacterium]